jgi:dipeptidyl aminopeptidase/acylaminoacyl peptidase
MTPVEIEARDGLTLVSYLSLPIGSDLNGDARPERPVPLVLLPHDGPWSRDSYGFNATHQWLANRGYAALSVNFRGSTGFGKAFLNAGNGEWGGRVGEDLLDAVQWAVENGVAATERVAIAGWGFGGYQALAGLTFAPETFRCGANFGGPPNLFSMLDAAPIAMRPALYRRIGDARVQSGRQVLRDASPYFRTSQVRSPLLLALGGRDPRVSREAVDQVAQAVRARRTGLTYLVFPDEGRELVRPHNRLSYLAVLEHFLGDCLGGRVEPVGAAFEGASIHVYDGAVNVPGLTAFARRPAVRPTSQPAAPILEMPGETPGSITPVEHLPETEAETETP